jgi:hypothetical protein
MIALIGKRSPADIQALLAHVTAFDTCALVNSGLVDKVGGDYVYMQGGSRYERWNAERTRDVAQTRLRSDLPPAGPAGVHQRQLDRRDSE